MEKEIEKAIEVTKTAFESAEERGESWANEVDIQLMQAGIEVLSAVAYGAETDTRLIAVVEIDDASIGIWHWDDGTWHAEPIKNPAAVELGRIGGSATSEAKKKAARENAKKGGRPKHQYSIIDAPGYHGDILRCYSSHATLSAAKKARGRSKSVAIIEVEDWRKRVKKYRAEVDALIATGSAKYI
jgi:hypothetical protein